MADVNKTRNRIWVMIKRLDSPLTDSTVSSPTDVFLDATSSTEDVVCMFKKTFNISDHLILKLRNHRGSIVPINSRLQTNSKSVPYTLEVVKPYQNVMPQERAVKHQKHTEAILHLAYKDITSRVDHLESELPNLKNKHKERLNFEMADMDKTLEFMTKRLSMAEASNWKGMFTKCPLW